MSIGQSCSPGAEVTNAADAATGKVPPSTRKTLRRDLLAPQVPPRAGVESSANRPSRFAQAKPLAAWRHQILDPRSRETFPRLCAVCLVLVPLAARAEEPIRLRETFAPGYQYRVKVHLSG